MKSSPSKKQLQINQSQRCILPVYLISVFNIGGEIGALQQTNKKHETERNRFLSLMAVLLSF